MKNRLVALFSSVALLFASLEPLRAEEHEAAQIAVDALLGRPACFLMMVGGSVVFLIGWPFAAMTDSVDRAAEVLVKKPARATFVRPLGDFRDPELPTTEWANPRPKPSKPETGTLPKP